MTFPFIVRAKIRSSFPFGRVELSKSHHQFNWEVQWIIAGYPWLQMLCRDQKIPLRRSPFARVLRQFKYHSLPPPFSLHFLLCYDPGKFDLSNASWRFSKIKSTFRISKML